MALNGYIKLHRKMLEWGWYGDPAVRAVWLHLLLSASFKDSVWNGMALKPGQVVIGTQKLACLLAISVQQVRTALRKLEATNEITRASTNKYTLITIVKWEDYQIDDEFTTNETTSTETDEQQTNNNQTTNEQQHRKNVKKYKNNIPPISPKRGSVIFSDYAGEDAALGQALADFEAMRKQQKKPMTDRAQGTLLKQLDGLSGGDSRTKIALLEQSILNCWASLYPLKEQPRADKPQFKFLDERKPQ